MELYTIDPVTNRRGEIIETYESFIWTDRYADVGDFEIVMEPNSGLVERLLPGTFIGFDQSPATMIVETILEDETDEGHRSVKIQGESLVSVLKHRTARRKFEDEPWVITGFPGNAITNVVKTVCIDGDGISSYDVIDDLSVSNLIAIPGGFPFPGGEPVVAIIAKEETVFDQVKVIADTYDVGFSLQINGLGVPGYAFTVYRGIDRSGINGVAFSPDSESLSAQTRLRSFSDFKTTAYVLHKESGIIQSVGKDGHNGIRGFSRRTITVDASDIEITGEGLVPALIDRGRQALARHNKIDLFDGTINPTGIYKYNRDYFLGDVVALIGHDNQFAKARVTEHIWSEDQSGVQSYPTLTTVLGGGM